MNRTVFFSQYFHVFLLFAIVTSESIQGWKKQKNHREKWPLARSVQQGEGFT